MNKIVKTTLQISLAPSDYRLVPHLLTHQLRAWQEQVDEVLIVVDLHKSSGRFSEGWEQGRAALLHFLEGLTGPRIETVDYSEVTRAAVSAQWCLGRSIPLKDFRGGPSYAYFFGLSAANGRYVFHSDADMFFGGGDQCWMAEAIKLYEQNPDILFLAPLSGPPALSGHIRTLPSSPDSRAIMGQRFNFMSTRLFMLDKLRFSQSIKAFRPSRPRLRERVKAFVEGNPGWDLPEHWMTAAMREEGKCRFEFLGSGHGMWSLHPPYRCEAFFDSLPNLVDLVENGYVPEDQLGCHDVNESMVDWSDAILRLKRNRWWTRLLSRVASVMR